ncbi:MAG: UDP-N-acetylglucosamine--N-acetylmuramyl-(pentapeptide) pyrophosphoryl-undecaprenol N-acetylglucosamine transferase [Clostridia bacterium]|nr:UDP-N-acetylglucosamine--N-acetylmuramyl-(pentapeptide) pyrophosphoryl-undecaprenol N-acetylglucosamine transferase [Clostridia bacterium]
MTSKTAVFTGGGTGGHIYPNLALIPDFKERGFRPVYVGGQGKTQERELAKLNDIPFFQVPTVKFSRAKSFGAIKNNLTIPSTLKKGVREATAILENLSPAFVFSKGGFVSLPVVIAAKKLRIPVFAHESDRTLGLANKIAKLCGAKILKGNPTATFQGEDVGIPLRRELFQAEKASSIERLSLAEKNADGKNVLLVLGGSSGATIFNDFVETKLDELTRKYFVLHVVGRGKGKPEERAGYLPFEYADNIADFYAVSDVVLSRAGATATFELSALKKRAVFVPLPKGASRGDQIYNAELAQNYGATVVLQTENEKTFFDNLVPAVDVALANPPMRPISNDTNGKIVNFVCDSLAE